MKIVSAAEMREIDRVTSEHFGVPSPTLMENAGTAVADFLTSTYPAAKRITVVAGKGNNGGDGFVVARKLCDSGREVRLVLLSDPSELKGDALATYRQLKVTPTIVRNGEELKQEGLLDADVIVDAILGTGFRPPVTGLYADAITAINASHAPVIAIDVPSGADSDNVGPEPALLARASAIVTFTAPKPAHIFGKLTSGPIVVTPIGSPDEAIISAAHMNLITARDVATLIGPRPLESNKGNYGNVLLIG